MEDNRVMLYDDNYYRRWFWLKTTVKGRVGSVFYLILIWEVYRLKKKNHDSYPVILLMNSGCGLAEIWPHLLVLKTDNGNPSDFR